MVRNGRIVGPSPRTGEARPRCDRDAQARHEERQRRTRGQIIGRDDAPRLRPEEREERQPRRHLRIRRKFQVLRPRRRLPRLQVQEQRRLRTQRAPFRVHVVRVDERVAALRLELRYLLVDRYPARRAQGERPVRERDDVVVEELGLELHSVGEDLLHADRYGFVARHGHVEVFVHVRRPRPQSRLSKSRRRRAQGVLAESQVEDVPGPDRLVVPREEVMGVPGGGESLLAEVRQDAPHGHDVPVEARRLLYPVAVVPDPLLADEGDLVGSRRGEDVPDG
mmetsp:Transcript_23050/g.49362  ORF Transcript_23050/g.49362 Transcript_23050/m.49362 type:complete len:280 (-) Transcript_23050:809-1648(-)